MDKKNKVYYENQYLSLLNALKVANSEEELLRAKESIIRFKEEGLNCLQQTPFDSLDGQVTEENYVEYKNNKNYNRFAKSNEKYINGLLDNQRTTEQEEKRINGKKVVRKVVKGVIVVGVVAGLITGVHSCNKNKTKNTESTTTTTTTEFDETSTLSTSEYTTEISTVSGFYDDYNSDEALASMSDNMSGIVINDPTSAQTTPGTTNGTTTAGSTNTEGTTAPTTTAGTTAPTTTQTTTPSTVVPTATATPTPVPYVGDDTVPTTEPITPSNTEPNPSDARNMPDIVVDEYDGVQPSYIEEDPNETYETYIDISSTTTATTTQNTSSTTSTQTYGGMVIEEDPNETYETFFDITKECSRKTLRR